jgi:pimeloyl-ACP methyl ester carboxylesterase
MSTERTWSFIKYNWVYNKSVHRSCHGGGCWRKLTHILCKSGHEVYTPTLTGLGERSHLLTKVIGLDTHIKDIFQVMEYEDLNNVILVGHSYRVLVIGGVAEKIPHRIKHLVYPDGYIPEDGKSAFDLVPLSEISMRKDRWKSISSHPMMLQLEE